MITYSYAQEGNTEIESLPILEIKLEQDYPYIRRTGNFCSLKVGIKKDTAHELRDKYRKALCDTSFDRFSWIHARKIDTR